jgi:hypothetical protein
LQPSLLSSLLSISDEECEDLIHQLCLPKEKLAGLRFVLSIPKGKDFAFKLHSWMMRSEDGRIDLNLERRSTSSAVLFLGQVSAKKYAAGDWWTQIELVAEEKAAQEPRGARIATKSLDSWATAICRFVGSDGNVRIFQLARGNDELNENELRALLLAMQFQFYLSDGDRTEAWPFIKSLCEDEWFEPFSVLLAAAFSLDAVYFDRLPPTSIFGNVGLESIVERLMNALGGRKVFATEIEVMRTLLASKSTPGWCLPEKFKDFVPVSSVLHILMIMGMGGDYKDSYSVQKFNETLSHKCWVVRPPKN